MGYMKFGTIKLLLITAAGIVLLFGAVLWGGSYFLPSVAVDSQAAGQQPAAGQNLVGSRAPYFDLPNLAGDHVNLGAYADKPLVILFWATWSQESTDQLHILDEYQASVPESKLVSLLAINSQEERNVASSFMHRGGYQIPVLLDTLGKAGESYHASALPVFYFIDRTGTVEEVYAGALSQKALGDKIEKILQ